MLTEVQADHEREALGPATPAALPEGYQQGAYLADADVEVDSLGGPVPPPPPPARRGPASFGDAARPAADVGEARWVTGGQSDHWGVGQFVPAGFEACLFVDDVPGDQDEWWELEKAHTVTIADIGTRHTTTPDRFYFAVWDGHGYPNDGLEHIPTFASAGRHRDYYLLEGPLSALPELVWPNYEVRVWRQPDLWWPADRAWIVCTDVDFWCNYVAGTQALVDEVAAAATTETHLVKRTDDLERVD